MKLLHLPKVLFTDKNNFHEGNFPSLLSAVSEKRINPFFVKFGDQGLKRASGDYAASSKQLAHWVSVLRDMSFWSLRQAHVSGVNLFETCRYELISYLMNFPGWYNKVTPNEIEVLYKKAFDEDREVLILNMAAAGFWLSYWNDFLDGSTSFDSACIFGGSQTYNRAFLALCGHHGIVPYLFEHFFTGNDHFMEVRRSPIQGNSELRLVGKTCSYGDRSGEFIRRVAEMENKNVKQPAFELGRGFDSEIPTVLILGQVVNDMSLINDNCPVLGSVVLYCNLVTRILETTDCNIIFKAHPYERAKTAGKVATTFSELESHVGRLSPGWRSRVRVVQDINIDSLLFEVDVAVTLTSQSAFEALLHEVPVITLGQPFYAHQGFTADAVDVEDVCKKISNGSWKSEFNQEVMSRFLQFGDRIVSRMINKRADPQEIVERFRMCMGPGSRQNRMATLTRNDRFEVGVKVAQAKSSVRKASDGGLVEGGMLRVIKTRSGNMKRKARKFTRDPKLFLVDAVRNINKRAVR